MKNKLAVISSLFLGAVFACQNAHAQAPQTVAITAASLNQGSTKDNNVNTTIKAPEVSPLTTARLLAKLAKDENLGGNYGSSTFPAGAKLIYQAGIGFQVWDKHNQLLVDVSDVLTLTVTGAADLNFGSFNDNNGQGIAPSTSSDVQLWTLTYDDTAFGGTRKVSITGVGTSTVTMNKPTPNGSYTETDSFKLVNANGEGIDDDGDPVIVTGLTITASGSIHVVGQ